VQSETLDLGHPVGASLRKGMCIQNRHCVRYDLDGRVVARQGAMVAYRGDLQIRTLGQGVKKLLKRAVTREGVALMEIDGRGIVWFADLAKNVVVLTLEPGDRLSVTGKTVLCFDPSLRYEIRTVKGAGMTGGGLFNCVFEGAGSLALTSHGEPLVVPVTPDAPLRADTDAVLAWSSDLEAGVHRSEGIKSLLKGGSGEAFQLELRGDGLAVLQPSEGPLAPRSGGGIADTVGELLG
jgi:uncharacterized protein (AIM24 family)